MNTLIGWRFVLTLLCCGLAASGSAQSPAPVPGARVLLSGSSTMAPLMVEVARRFQTLHPGVQIEVRMGGSGRGIDDARQGKADIGMVSRSLGATEGDLRGVPVARDGVAVIVHRDNPVQSLSERQLLDIYSGKVANWRQLGGRDAPLHVLAATREGGSSELISQYLQLPHEQIKARRLVGPNAQRVSEVAADPLALIWLSLGEAERNVRDGAAIKLVAIDGVTASSQSVRNGNYPIARPLTLVTREEPRGIVRTFIEFCLSSQVTDIVLAFNFVPYMD